MNLTELNERRRVQADDQESLNRIVDRWAGHRVRSLLVEIAELEHAAYPQYAGYWDDWQVGRIGTDITTKGGDAFHAGDVVLFKHRDHFIAMYPETVVYSVRLGWNVVVMHAGIRELSS